VVLADLMYTLFFVFSAIQSLLLRIDTLFAANMS
jgi:hypothetical protein